MNPARFTCNTTQQPSADWQRYERTKQAPEAVSTRCSKAVEPHRHDKGAKVIRVATPPPEARTQHLVVGLVCTLKYQQLMVCQGLESHPCNHQNEANPIERGRWKSNACDDPTLNRN